MNIFSELLTQAFVSSLLLSLLLPFAALLFVAAGAALALGWSAGYAVEQEPEDA